MKKNSNKTQKQTKNHQADELENCVPLELVVFIAIQSVFQFKILFSGLVDGTYTLMSRKFPERAENALKMLL